MSENIDAKIAKCPLIHDWCEYNGETYVAVLDYEKSANKNRIYFDLFYCMTKSFSPDMALISRMWTPRRFNKSPLSRDWGVPVMTDEEQNESDDAKS